MPNRVHILPDEIASRIAAGEVVERPASVVKELVENGVDADADRIVVEVVAGGKESIRISDNGCGMSRDDALLALERHATSKIDDLSDLRTLRTHGFRGEALPSIASVSRMTLETCLEGEVEGTRILVEGGRVRDVTSAGRGQGTTLTVHGLFFNVPARRKFLKGVDTEFRHIANAIMAMAMANPDIAFVLTHNSRRVLNLDRADRQRRMESILNIRLGEDAVYMESSTEGVGVWGSVGKPEGARKSGAQQMLIVNGRWVQHKALTYAVYDGFGGLLPKGFMPSYCLFLEIDPARLDVNVHPSKREVRFADERTVYRAVAQTVSRALRQAEIIPDVGEAQDDTMPVPEMPAPVAMDSLVGIPSQPGQVREGRSRAYELGPPGLGEGPQMALPLTVRESDSPDLQPAQDLPDPRTLVEAEPAQVSVWQLHQKYVLAHIKNGVIIIDQHLAHQRILYEEAIGRFREHPGTAQRLLFPLTLDFGVKEILVVREAMPLLEKIGFGIRDFGGNTVVVDAIPMNLKAWEEGELLRHIVADLMEEENRSSISPGQQEQQVTPQEHKVAVSYAWHTSIRSGEGLSILEMQGLIDQLFATREPFVDPYGKPIVVKMSITDIDRLFDR